jgi:hypothetical protein
MHKEIRGIMFLNIAAMTLMALYCAQVAAELDSLGLDSGSWWGAAWVAVIIAGCSAVGLWPGTRRGAR